VLEHSIEETIDQLDACDRKAYRSLIEPVFSNFAALVEEILCPILHIPEKGDKGQISIINTDVDY